MADDVRISPQGYNIGEEPVNENPFWSSEDNSDIVSVQCTKTTAGDNDVYSWSYTDKDGVTIPIITQSVPHRVSDGVTFTPAVSADGVISWTNNGGLPNPSPVSIKGPTGSTGPAGATGARGPKGDTGATGAQGVQGPRGVKGDTGAQGPQGIQGPRGFQGPKGDTGNTPNVTAKANVIQGAPATPASCTVTKTGTAENPVFTFTFQNIKGNKGDKGDTGETGARGPQGPAGMGTITIGTTTTGAAGTSASVTNRGTAKDAILDFTIPQGAAGAAGADGAAATIAVGTVSTGAPGSAATVTNRGTSSEAVFDFSIPQGAAGANGTNGVGVPAGGTAGQVLTKVDGTDFNTGWTTPAAGGGGVYEITVTKTGDGNPGCKHFTFSRGSACHMILLYGSYQVDDWGEVVCDRRDQTSIMIYWTGTYVVPVTVYVVPGQGTEQKYQGILHMHVDYDSNTGLCMVTATDLWYNGTVKTLGNTGNWIAPISVLGFKK